MKYLIITFVTIVLTGCGKPKTPDISIHDAVVRKNIKLINQHLASGTDVNSTNIDKELLGPKKHLAGASPLILAINLGYYEIIKMLISEGADVNAKTNKKLTALMISAGITDLQVVQLLIKNGANINAKGRGGITALHLTVSIPQAKMKNALVAENRKYNASHHKKIIEFLISNNANINALADNGKTPLDVAVSENPQVAGILIKHGAKKSKELKAKVE